MSRAPRELVQAFVEAFGHGDARYLAPFLSEDVTAEFEDAGRLHGRRTVVDFWRRLFQTYPEIDLKMSKLVAEEDLVIAELLYELKPGKGQAIKVRTISVFEIRDDSILGWMDHADLTDVAAKERALWRRLGAARW